MISHSDIGTLPAAAHIVGNVSEITGAGVRIAGMAALLAIGDRVQIRSRDGRSTLAEIVAFHGQQAQALAFGSLEGIGPGSQVWFDIAGAPGTGFGRGATLAPDETWLGRVIDPLGRPLDRAAALSPGLRRSLRAHAPVATRRARLGARIDLGVRAVDAFATCRHGQRLGLFAGSGVGKSTLLAMLARNARCDVVILALVGERGREVREFLEDDLGADGLARSVVVVATSDSPPLLRRDAALAAMTIAEFFRDQGKSVLLLMDSVTRYCLALREIGLAAGEPPATRGYPPSMFAELPRLLERAGPGSSDTGDPEAGGPEAGGQITALFTVLVEGDDHNEPIADAVRGILDGHVVLDRRIGETGRYPAIDILRSLSRTVPGCLAPREAALARRAREVLALHADMADMVRLGAYRPGTDPALDTAIRLTPRIESMLRQDRAEPSTGAAAFDALAAALEDAA
jgi:flagellum-specific ATP synthase